MASSEGEVPPAPGWQRALNVARPGLMALAACVVVLAVVLWHVGGRRQDAWLGVIAVGVALYFSLRAWGLLTRGGRTRRQLRLRVADLAAQFVPHLRQSVLVVLVLHLHSDGR